MLAPFATTSDAIALGFDVSAPNLLRASSRIRTYLRSVRYPVEIASPSDDLIELTCQIAARLGGTTPDSPIAQGVQTQGVGPMSVGYGWDAWKAQSGLTAGETATLKRMFPEIPRTLSMGSPAGPNPEPAA